MLTWPVLGRFLRWRHARLVLQVGLLLIAGFLLFDGLLGPQLAPKNLATTGVWLEYRGLVILGLLVVGNLFCMACPFMLPRQAGRWLREHVLGGGRRMPRALRSKWPALALTVVFFYTYERYSLWASPWLTAWVAVGYFLAAFLVDTVFQGAAFCKYVCPLGQFNFFGSLMSPFEVTVRQPQVCAGCETKDCIRALPGKAVLPGRVAAGQSTAARSAWTYQRGCELNLFQPAKVGNMDCTFCLDCVHACPHDDVGLLSRMPGQELWSDPFRSGIGHFSRRPDLAALVAVLVFGAYVNAFNMIKPVYALRSRVSDWLGLTSPGAVLFLTFFVGLVVLPAALLTAAALATRLLGGARHEPLRMIVQRNIYCLVPLGVGMWAAHYSFHFLVGGLTIVPVIQSFVIDAGLAQGLANWSLGPLVPADWLFPLESIFLYLGALGSLVVAFQIALHSSAAGRRQRNAIYGIVLPWAGAILLLLGFALWIMLQPMEMRGTMFMFGTTGG
jgi:polyferredoxin